MSYPVIKLFDGYSFARGRNFFMPVFIKFQKKTWLNNEVGFPRTINIPHESKKVKSIPRKLWKKFLDKISMRLKIVSVITKLLLNCSCNVSNFCFPCSDLCICCICSQSTLCTLSHFLFFKLSPKLLRATKNNYTTQAFTWSSSSFFF